jgi:hypothetical protein
VTLGELITLLVDLDLSDPLAHDAEVGIEGSPDDGFWIVVGDFRTGV